MDILQPDLVRAIVFERPNWIEEGPDSSAGILEVVNSVGLVCREDRDDVQRLALATVEVQVPGYLLLYEAQRAVDASLL